ncbi:MAG: hypothetical protein SGCHY_003111 [Lobulomycetales sp.]
MWGVYNSMHYKHCTRLPELPEISLSGSRLTPGTRRRFSNSTVPEDYFNDDIDDVDDSASDSSSTDTCRHSQVYNATRELMDRLYSQAVAKGDARESGKLSGLLDDSIDSQCRSRLNQHYAKSGMRDVWEEVADRAARNGVSMPLPGYANVPPLERKDVLFGGYDEIAALTIFCSGDNQPVFSFQGMVPYMNPKDQLKRLRAREKIWDDVRPPVRGWYEKTGPDFAKEARQNRRLLASPEIQVMEAECRDTLMDMYRASLCEHAMTSHSKAQDINIRLEKIGKII